jgi:peptide/nickel transport system substrate-binding protein
MSQSFLKSPTALPQRSPLARLLTVVAATVVILGCSPSQDSEANKTLKVTFFRDNTTLVSLDPFQVYWLEHRVPQYPWHPHSRRP